MWLLNLGKPVNIPPLNEAMAIELGANLLGETILFSVGAAVLIIEYNRQTTKQVAKEKQQEDEMNNLNFIIQDLSFQIEKQDAQLRELFRHVYDLDSRVVKKPWTVAQKTGADSTNVTEIEPSKSKQTQSVIVEAISYIENNVFKESSETGEKSL